MQLWVDFDTIDVQIGQMRVGLQEVPCWFTESATDVQEVEGLGQGWWRSGGGGEAEMVGGFVDCGGAAVVHMQGGHGGRSGQGGRSGRGGIG